MTARKRNSGMTLIELMVAMAIGMFLLIGAISVFMQARTTFKLTESLSRLQENGRFALDVVESDIRMAHYFGLNSRSYNISNRRKTTVANGIGPATCGNNWAIDLDNSVAGTNNVYTWGCAPPAAQPYRAGTDTIVIRRVSDEIAVPVAGGRFYIKSQRASDPKSVIFQGTPAPALPANAVSEIHQLIVNGYYVATRSNDQTLLGFIPSLRKQTLNNAGAIIDQEVMTGIEDMQIQFGLDTDTAATLGTTVAPGRGSIDRYVNADDPVLNPANAAAYIKDAEILAVRIWLLVRSERTEQGIAAQTFTYAGTTTTYTDGFRRVLVSKTIYIRNGRPSS